MVQESKLWYDYIIMVRSGNAALKCSLPLVLWNEREREPLPYPTCCYARYMMRAVNDAM